MKKLILMLALAVMLLSSTGAQAYFEDVDPIGTPDNSARTSIFAAFKKTGASELGVDLLPQAESWNPATSGYSVSVAKDLILGSTGATTWKEVRFSSFGGYRNGSPNNSVFYGFLNTPTLESNEYSVGNYNNALGNMDSVLQDWGGGLPSTSNTFVGSATIANSFGLRMDAMNAGNLGGIINQNLGGINLSKWDDVATQDYVYNLYLYAFSKTNGVFGTSGAQPLGMMSLSFDGASALVEYSAVPVPAAIWILGSGLLGVIGLRRRQS